MKRPDELTTFELYGDLGKLVARLRMKDGLTQQDIAASIGCKRGWVAKVEQGRCALYAHTLISLAYALGVKPSRLLREVCRSSAK